MDSFLILIAAPGSQAIDDTVLAAVREATGSAPRWLSAREAVEFPIQMEEERKPEPHSPSRESIAHTQLWGPTFTLKTELTQRFRRLPIDICLVPAANRRKRLLLADMDSTMIRQECIDELGELAGFGAEIREVTARAMRGELDFEGALLARVALMKGLAADVIAQVIRNRITFMPGGKTLVRTMRANGAYAALVSGGFTQFTTHVATVLGFDEHRANDLLISGDLLSGTVRLPILGKDAKVDALRSITQKMGLSASDVIAVGDGANDIPMLQAAGLGVALHAKPKTREAADVAIDHGDLTALLFLQGYRQSDFVE